MFYSLKIIKNTPTKMTGGKSHSPYRTTVEFHKCTKLSPNCPVPWVSRCANNQAHQMTTDT